jgi:hypothetical protein
MNEKYSILQEEKLPSMCVIPRSALIDLINIAVKSAVDSTLRELRLLKDEISQREAHRIFGGGVVQSLLNRGKIERVVGVGRRSKIIYFRSQIETALKLEGINLLTN